ncbi:MAG: AAA family ATPase, partial [Candidatus Riflebacteria bacterium]|nr:AAA family ATPase [Candidatus Riflebacteria bacterium]
MKGFTHFISGMAVASFFPQAVHMAASESSFILCLGGLFGILPDTLDFKLAKYFYKSDFEVKPDPNKLDAREIANGIAQAVNKAIETGRGTVQLHTMQIASNRWRSYLLRFDTKTSEICVDIGPEVDTGQIPFDGTELKDPEKAHARVKVNCEFYQQFDKVSNIAIMTGPCFEFAKREDGKMEIVFLPWHRQWSHSFTLGMLIAFLVGLVTFFTIPEGPHPELYTIPRWMLYPLIILFGSMVHIIEDNEGLTLEDKRIAETIVATHARLCIIDPLQAYLGNDGDMLNAVRMRNLLRNLTRIAEDHRCAILLICHMSKSAGNKSLY